MSRRKAWKVDGRRMIREDRVEVSTMAQFSEMLKLVHITVQHLAVDSHPNAPAAQGLVLAVRPLRGIGLTSIVHAVNTCAKLILRLMLLSVIGGWKVSTLHDRVISIFDLFETSRFENSQRKYRGRRREPDRPSAH